MNIVHILRRADGGISILRPVGDDFDLADEIAKWQAAAPAGWLPIASAVPLDAADLPSNRLFRDAWEISGNQVQISVPKAADIVRDRLRAERAPQFEKLDADYLRALDERDAVKQETIAARKKALREITDRSEISNARTPDALAAVLVDLQREVKSVAGTAAKVEAVDVPAAAIDARA